MAHGHSNGGGHIFVHQRTLDDQTQIFGGGIDIKIMQVDSTLKQNTHQWNTTCHEYQNLLQHINTWWMETYP